jgi:hypothetical protein
MGYDPFADSSDVRVAADVRRVEGRLRGHLAILDANGDAVGARDLDTSTNDCDELVLSLALAVSIVLDSLPASDATTTAPPADPSREPLPTTVEPEPTTVEAERTNTPTQPSGASSTPVAFVTAGTHASLGSAPSPAGGARIGVGVRSGWASLGVEGEYDLPAASTDRGRGQVSVDHFAVALLPCAKRSIVFGCALASYGVMHGEGRDVSVQQSGSAPYVAVGGRFGLEIPITDRFGVLGQIEARSPLLRPRFEVHDGDGWTLPALSGSAGILGTVRFL